MNIIPVVLSGGSGTRLWPVSRKAYPKQFLNLTGDHSLFQQTVFRGLAIDKANPIVVCNEQHRFLVAEQLLEIGLNDAPIILEPVARNTAPAIALAAIQAEHQTLGKDSPLLLVLPSDHLIKNPDAFARSVQIASRAAQKGKIVTFGIVPTEAETGYGYIHAGNVEEMSAAAEAFPVLGFTEKPDERTAHDYLASGEYLWNSGMFLFQASRYLEELEKYNPEMLEACRTAMASGVKDLDFLRPNKTAFESCPSDSIDYAVMEKTQDAVVVPMNAGWSDIGEWGALWKNSEKDSDGNAIKGEVVTIDSKDCLIHSDHRMVATLGLEDIVVVETADAVLVANKHRTQDVKKIIASLNGSTESLAENHRKVYRPWGHYDSIDSGPRFQVKRITVKPEATLSLQKHLHRAEYWVVVTGTAEITCGDKVAMLTENESIHIPLGEVHRVANPGKIPLEMIEVQSGSYLGEDDIIRFSDTYGRVEENA